MKTICVGGTSSHCGKTAVTCLLLRAFPGWAAIKVTPCRPDTVCPRGDDCGACGAPRSRYEAVTDVERLNTAGKDTARFIESGAGRVVWVRALPQFLPEALESALHEVSDAPGVIVESTSAFQFLQGLHVMVRPVNKPDVKDSARRCASLIDLVAVNLKPTELENAPDVPRELNPWKHNGWVGDGVPAAYDAPSGLRELGPCNHNGLAEDGLPAAYDASGALRELDPWKHNGWVEDGVPAAYDVDDQADVQTVPMCAVLPPEHSVNRQFLSDCISRVSALSG